MSSNLYSVVVGLTLRFSVAKVYFLEFELKLFLLIAAFLINGYFFLVRNISGYQVELTVGLSSLTLHTCDPPLILILDMLF